MNILMTYDDATFLIKRMYRMVLESQNANLLPKPTKVWPMPVTGVPVAMMLSGVSNGDIVITDNIEEADAMVDDIIHTGDLMRYYCDMNPGKPFLALVSRGGEAAYPYEDYITLPWQQQVMALGNVERIATNVRQILAYVGEDVERGGLIETPRRVAKAWLNSWAQGYQQDPADILKVFDDGGEKYDQMVTVKNIPFYSHCEHHMAPFFGTVSISYIPNGKIVGLSKLSRLTDVFAKRLQVQERLTDQIADALAEHLDAKGVGVVIEARHMCMESRGIAKQGSTTVTTALRGAIREESETRSEFLRSVGQ